MHKKNKRRLSKTAHREENLVAEMVYDSEIQKTAFCIFDGEDMKTKTYLSSESGKEIVPYAPDHPFVKDKVILFAQKAEKYGEVENLIINIRYYIHKYVDLSEDFEIIATHYVLLSWLYESSNVLGYLRIMGDYGTGKTRFLTVVGGICYKPIFLLLALLQSHPSFIFLMKLVAHSLWMKVIFIIPTRNLKLQRF